MRTKNRPSIRETYREGSRFFMREGPLYAALDRLTERLDSAGIDYALIGGMALVAHGYRRFTEDLDVLLTQEGLETFTSLFVGKGYVPAFQGARKSFRDTASNVRIEVVTTGEFPGDGRPKPVAFPAPGEDRIEEEGMKVVGLERLIELKLASGLSASHRMRDLADVQDLIRIKGLPLSFSNNLDPSVREEYERLWRSSQSAGET